MLNLYTTPFQTAKRQRAFLWLSCLALLLGPIAGKAQVFFSDSGQSGYYDSGLAFVTPTSVLAQAGPTNDKIPLSPVSLFDRDALKIAWTSLPAGDWSALIISAGFGFQNLSTADTLSFWVYSPEVLAKADMPLIFLEGATGASKSAKYPLGNFIKSANLTPNTWTHVAIPLAPLRNDAANASFDFGRTKAVILGQGVSDGQPRELYLDQVQTYSARTQAFGQAPPSFEVDSYSRHRELHWPSQPGNVLYYAVLANGAPLRVITTQAGDTSLLVWPNLAQSVASSYRLTTYTPGFGFGTDGATVSVPALEAATDEELYDMTQRYTLRYFWEFAHPMSGLARERNTSNNTVTIGGSGFGIMAWMVGVHRGWLQRDEVADRLNTTLDFLEKADRYHGAWPHWMDGRNGNTIPFSPRDNGGDLVETAFMAQALLTARQYFDGASPIEDSIRTRCTRLWEGIEWDWYQRPGEEVLTWHWSPDQAWAINLKIRGFNEAQIVYLLGIASPTHPIPANLYKTGWITPNYRSFQGRYGIFIPAGPRSGGPMFFAHYSYLGFDPRFWRDDVTNYFVRNQLHVDYQVAYAEDNPEDHQGYSNDSWGFTASDDPLRGYAVHAAAEDEDNGTLTPTAALSSMPYRPQAATRALRHFYEEYGQRVFGQLGFYDAFNPDLNWFATSTIAIDQGPIVGMIENHRSGLLWKEFMANPEIAPALLAAGFIRDSTSVGTSESVLAIAELRVSPNPSSGQISIHWPAQIDFSELNSMEVYNALGQIAFRQNLSVSTDQDKSIDLSSLPSGHYILLFTSADARGKTSIYRAQITLF